MEDRRSYRDFVDLADNSHEGIAGAILAVGYELHRELEVIADELGRIVEIMSKVQKENNNEI